MGPLLGGFSAFLVFLAVHVIVWRIRRPVGQYGGLLALSGGVLVASLAAFRWISIKGWGAGFIPRDPTDYFSYVLFYVPLSLGYMVTYAAVQADSPSLSIVLAIEKAGPDGISRVDMHTRFPDKVLVMPRLDDLLTNGLARHVDGRYVLTAHGARLARLHLFYRRLMRLELGG